MSDLVASTETGCSRKKSRVTRRVVASSLTCLAPFSQYSLRCRLRGSGHAQPGAVDAVGLVDGQQVERGAPQRGVLERELQRVPHGGQTGGPLLWRLDGESLVVGGIACGHLLAAFRAGRDGVTGLVAIEAPSIKIQYALWLETRIRGCGVGIRSGDAECYGVKVAEPPPFSTSSRQPRSHCRSRARFKSAAHYCELPATRMAKSSQDRATVPIFISMASASVDGAVVTLP